MQQALLDKLKGDTDTKRNVQKFLFHSCIKGFFNEFISSKRNINLTRLILMYASIVQGIEKNSRPDRLGNNKRLLDPNKDIADGELIHFATFGTWVNEERAPVYAVTFDSPSEVRNRLIAFKSISAWVSAHLHPDFQYQWGKVFCINKSSYEISVISVEELTSSSP